MNIIQHVENYLGQIDAGWKLHNSADGISVSRFCNQPANEVNTYVTFGLSRHMLSMPNNREVRHELIFSAHKNILNDEIVLFLLRISDLIITKHEALLRGQVIGPGKPLFTNSPMNAVYVSMPVMFDDEFATFKGTSPPTVLVWLIPILSDEAKYIQKHGWETFEDILERKDPDLSNLERQSVISP